MAKKQTKSKRTYAEMSREERVTGKPPLEETLDKDSREYRVTHGKGDK